MEWSYTAPRYATTLRLTCWHVVSVLLKIWWSPPRYATIPILICWHVVSVLLKYDDNTSVLPPTLVQSLPIVCAWSRSLSFFSALVCDLLSRQLFHGSPKAHCDKTRLREIQTHRPGCIHTFAGPQPWTTWPNRKDWTGNISRAWKKLLPTSFLCPSRRWGRGELGELAT